MNKTCKACAETKPVSEFYKSKNVHDGYQNTCKVCWKARVKKNQDSDERREYMKTYNKNNRDKINATRQRRLANDPRARISHTLRGRFAAVLRGDLKHSSVVDLLGVSRDEFVVYLESLFLDGMSWDNYGEWEIDHIKPIAKFDDPQDPKCWHYSNLQPLCKEDNRRKSATYNG